MELQSPPPKFLSRNDSIGLANDKTGTLMTAVMHVFTAVVGAGVLNLPYAVSWLGWIAGPLLITAFFVFSLLSSVMLSQCFEVNGVEHERYHHLVNHLLGRRKAILASVFQLANIFLVMWAYTITGGGSIVAIAQVACEYSGADLDSSQCFAPATGGVWKSTLIFGGSQLLVSQVRNLEEAWWVSVLGTLGSLIYSIIALILGLANASNGLGSIGGNDGSSMADKAFEVLNALGSIAFAYNFSLILPEIQSTLKQPPSAVRTMNRVSGIAITGSYVFYILIACGGYAALGSSVQPIILDSFCGPNWTILLAQIAILIHMLSAYQVFGQALFNTVESHVKFWLVRRALRMEVGHRAQSGSASHPEAIEEGDETEDVEEAEDAGDAGDAGEAGAKASEQTLAGPFDTAGTGNVKLSAERQKEEHMFGFDRYMFDRIEQRLSSVISGEIIERSGSVTSQGLRQRRGSAYSSIVYETYSRAHDPPIGPKKRRLSMFSVDTGFANEQVVLNDEGALLPLPWRLFLRSVLVCIITLLACVMPFFGAFVGLAGAVTWYPLAIYFPFAAYRKVYPVTRGLSISMRAISLFTLLVALAAVVGSVRSIIVGFSTYSIFGVQDEPTLPNQESCV